MGDFLHTMGGKIAAAVSGILLLFSGGAHTPTNQRPSTQTAAAVATQEVAEATARPTTQSATTTIVNNYVSNPTIERVVEKQIPASLAGYVTESAFLAKINELSDKFGRIIYGSTYPAPPTSYGSGGILNAAALSNRIDSLSKVTISNLTVSGVSGLTDADIPDGITASSYLPLSGGTLTGTLTGTNLTLSGNLTVSGAQTLSGAITIPYVNATSTVTDSTFVRFAATNATTTNATTTNFAISGTPSSMLSTNANGSVGALTIGNGLTFSSNTLSLAFGTTSANIWTVLQQFLGGASTTQLSVFDRIFVGGTATSTVRGDGVASSLPFASSTAVTVSGTGYFGAASTTNLTVSGSPSGVLTTNSAGTVSASSTLGVNVGGTGATTLNDLIALGTNTTGNYVATVAGTANQISVSGSGSESAAVTLSLPSLVSLTQASSTRLSIFDRLYVGDTATTTILGSATSTFSAGIQTTALNITSTSATSTASNGWNLSAGCFAVNGTCVGGGSTSFANPSASIGLTAVNGSASTAMRSDAAPALSQAILPTWTSLHQFTGGASSTLLSIYNNAYFGATATSSFSSTGALTLASALGVGSGGTGQTSFGQGWLSSNGTTISASTSPTVNYITATSTTATSTFANGLNITSGCFAVNGTCLPSTDTVVRLSAIQSYTSTQTWTKPASFSYAVVEIWGGGGAGGNTTGAGNQSGGGGGGGGGGYAMETYTASVLSLASYSATVGAAGGTSNFGGLATSTGGSAGANNSGNTGGAGGAGGTGSGGNVNITGDTGSGGVDGEGTNLYNGPGGSGGGSPRGSSGGGGGKTSANGASGQVPGGGGGGAGGPPGGTGGAGGAGMIIVYEYTTVTSGTDLAENYPTADPTLGAGDLVQVDGTNPISIKRAEKNDPSPLIGIISTQPGLLLSDEAGLKNNSGQRPVALSGRVPTRVNLENGPIAIGDRIALSSEAGVGMKAGPLDPSVGIALESYGDPFQEGSIIVFMNLQPGLDVSAIGEALLAAPHATATPSPELSTTTATSTTASYLNSFLRGLFAKISQWFADAANGIGDFFAKRIHTEELCVEDVCVTRDQFAEVFGNRSAEPQPATGGAATNDSVPEDQPPSEEAEPEIVPADDDGPATVSASSTLDAVNDNDASEIERAEETTDADSETSANVEPVAEPPAQNQPSQASVAPETITTPPVPASAPEPVSDVAPDVE